ncbi:hypothetical protein [Gardnerella sp. Marseille-Q2328]|uniref:hypothetical protein n=1 Tax=Gardnerella sp. Marseille-Q2328 TaxID=2759694 RepID=UPI0020240E89|nr:hypothetical protein [Gardnerella sp. Marseille-Q2328]
MWNICGRISGVCCCFGGFLEHLRENLRHLLLFWWFFGTFAGEFSGICCCFGVFVEHLRGNLRRLRDDLLERCKARAKSTRSGNSLKLEVRGTSNASLGVDMEHLPEFFLRKMLLFWWFFGTFAGEFI